MMAYTLAWLVSKWFIGAKMRSVAASSSAARRLWANASASSALSAPYLPMEKPSIFTLTEIIA